MGGKPKKTAKHSRHKSKDAEQPKHWYGWLVGAGVFVAVVAAVLAWQFYNNRALPGVRVGNVPVSQTNAGKIRETVKQQQALLTATITMDGQATTVPLEQLGVRVNVEATVDNALRARRSGNWLRDAAVWSPVTVPLVLDNDWGMLKEYIKQHYPSLFVDPVNAQLTYDSGSKQFVITPGTPGTGFDIRQFEQSLPAIAARPGPLNLQPISAPADPLITEGGLTAARDALNQRLKLGVHFMFNGGAVATLDADTIASWAHIVPDATQGTATFEFDKAKITQYITDTVAPKIAKVPVDRKVVVDEQSGHQTVLVAGKAGQEVADITSVTDAVHAALTDNKPLDQPLKVEDAPFKTITLKGESKWIEIDISKQTLTLYVDTTPLQSFLISSGKAGTPTELGTFYIYSKLTSQTMTGTIAGEYYYLPNIKWVQYFDGDEAIHGTYWHHNFGHPMSHGCINMTEADAKTVYDFAPVGTKVVVHE